MPRRCKKPKPIPPDPATPDGWLVIHRPHGCVFYEVKIAQWHRWRCRCGEHFCFTNEERDADPGKYRL